MMKQNWVLKNKKGDFKAVAREQGVSGIMARLLINRDLDTKEKRDDFLHPDASSLERYGKLKNSGTAAEILTQAVRKHKKIRIIGDYDVDGITSTYILYDALSNMGADVSFRIPDRITDGYGINGNMVREAAENGIDVILTCDNGISEYDTIELAKKMGMTVVLTDHHEVPQKDGCDILPPADVVVNPHQAGETNTYKKYCGCVVAMKVLDEMGTDTGKYMPYAAMATLCDVMELTGENRAIVKLGLEALKRCTDTGLTALIRACSLDRTKVSAYNIGFNIGPCLNASGRLNTAEKGLALLLEQDEERAAAEAEELVELNNERKEMTARAVQKAVDRIEKDIGNGSTQRVLVVYLPDCHESIAGIVAGRIREYYYRPAIILTDSENGLKGSGRSIPGYHMYEGLCKVSDLLTRFGGHPMAAGLSLPPENAEALGKRLNETCTLTDSDLMEKVRIDMKLPFEYVTPQLIDEIEEISPTGNGNEKVLFAEKNLHPLRAQVISGKKTQFLKFFLQNENGTRFEAVYFGDASRTLEEMRETFGPQEVEKMLRRQANNVTFSATYTPVLNEFNGNKTIEARIEGFLF